MLNRNNLIFKLKQLSSIVKILSAFSLFFIFSIASIILISSPQVYADEGGEKPSMRIQISPVENRVTLNANETNEYTFNVDNTGSEGYR